MWLPMASVSGPSEGLVGFEGVGVHLVCDGQEFHAEGISLNKPILSFLVREVSGRSLEGELSGSRGSFASIA